MIFVQRLRATDNAIVSPRHNRPIKTTVVLACINCWNSATMPGSREIRIIANKSGSSLTMINSPIEASMPSTTVGENRALKRATFKRLRTILRNQPCR